MKRPLCILFSLVFTGFIVPLMAQKPVTTPLRQIGIEYLRYPAGHIPALRVAWGFSAHSQALALTGYNIARRQDFGKHDSEKGQGPGMALGYRYRLWPEKSGFYADARLDLWWLTIDWEDLRAGVLETGATRITIFQPTMGIGYDWMVPATPLSLSAGFHFGREINVKTEGEPVGEGGVSLLVLSANYRL